MFQDDQWQDVVSDSGFIKRMAYDATQQNLGIEFGNGKRYVYHGVGSETMQQAQEAPSFGKFFHSGIKGKFDSKELVPPDPNKEAQA